MAFSLATILLQAGTVTVDSTAAMADSIVNSAPVQEVTKVVVEEFSVLDLLGKGGYVMYPIGFLFAAAVFLFIEHRSCR